MGFLFIFISMRKPVLKILIKEILREWDGLHNQSGNSSQCSGCSHDVSIPDITQMVRDPLNDPMLNGKLHEEGERTEHFSVKWNEPDIISSAGKIFLGDKWFANAVPVSKDWNPKYAGKWWINRHEEAFKLDFPSSPIYFEDVQSLLNYLEKWYSTKKSPLNEQYKFDDFKWLGRQDGFGIPTDVYYGSIFLGVIVSSPDGYMIGLVKGPKNDITIKKSPKNMFKTKNDVAKVLHNTWKELRYIGETK